MLQAGEQTASQPGHFLRETTPGYPLKKKFSRLRSQSGHFGEEKNLLSQSGIKPLFFGYLAHGLVTVLTIKSQLTGLVVVKVLSQKSFHMSRQQS